MFLQPAATAGELRDLLRGIPQDTPIRVLNGPFELTRICVGYGSDPKDLSHYIVVLDLNAREGVIQ